MNIKNWVIATLLLSTGINALAATHHAPASDLTPAQVLAELKKGNQRFITNRLLHRDYQHEMLSSYASQHPEVVILSCMDSRNIPYLTFDQGIGEVFSLRVAGNVLNDDMLGSMEYATKITGARLIIVMGHTRCGAIAGACKSAKLGHLSGLLHKITPAVLSAKNAHPKASCEDEELIDAIAWQNVRNVMKAIPLQSPVIAGLLKKKQIAIVGAMYDLQTGKTVFPND